MVQETLQAQDVGIGQGFEGDGGRGAKRKGVKKQLTNSRPRSWTRPQLL